MLSGKAAAEAAFDSHQGRAFGRRAGRLRSQRVRDGAIGADLKKVRNVKPMWSKWGLTGVPDAGWSGHVDQHIWFFPVRHDQATARTDAEATEPADQHKPIDYPKPDGVLSFDRLTNVAFAATNHEESQPCHLRLGNQDTPIQVNLPKYAEPAQRYCPAGVYEVVEKDGKPEFVVNFQNCVHCKTCDIKDPSQNITWTTPQGGDGPNYPNM